MEKTELLIKGDSGSEYIITLKKNGPAVTMVCTCSGCMNGQLCKHRLRLLDGDFSAVQNKENMATASDIISAAKVLMDARDTLAELEKQVTLLKKEVNNNKKRLARLMAGG